MFRTLIAACVVSLGLALAGGGPAVAENGNQNYLERIDRCLTLVYWFDRTKTDNADAIALRDAAEDNCLDARENAIHRGEEQIRQAFRLLGRAP